MWVNQHVVYEQGSFLGQTQLYEKYFDGRKAGPKEKGDFRKEFEKVLVKFKENNRHFNPVSSLISIQSGNERQKRGWMGLKFY